MIRYAKTIALLVCILSPLAGMVLVSQPWGWVLFLPLALFLAALLASFVWAAGESSLAGVRALQRRDSTAMPQAWFPVGVGLVLGVAVLLAASSWLA